MGWLPSINHNPPERSMKASRAVVIQYKILILFSPYLNLLTISCRRLCAILLFICPRLQRGRLFLTILLSIGSFAAEKGRANIMAYSAPLPAFEMRIPTLTGTIKRRLLVNFRADPDVVRTVLPAGFEPKLQDGNSIVG